MLSYKQHGGAVERVPVRLQRIDGLPRKGESAREHMASAESGVLEIDEGAFEILSHLSGETMAEPQRAALLPTLSAFLAGEVDTRSRAPLSQAGAFGAMLGVVHFALRRSGGWWFTQLPHEGRPTPDIFAVSDGGEVWNLETKGVAPHSGEFPRHGQRIDICHNRIRVLRDKGRSQLASGFVIPQALGPSLRVLDGFGGRALAVTVVPDGRLVARDDLAAAARRGCPPGGQKPPGFMPCTHHCLATTSSVREAAVVGLLWEEPAGPSGSGGGAPPERDAGRRVISALHAVVCASWAKSTKLADDALLALPERLLRLDEVAAVDELSLRALQATRGVASVRARASMVSGLHRVAVSSELNAEIARGVRDAPPLVELGVALKSDRRARGQAVVLDELSGRLDSTGLRLVPDLAWIDQAVLGASAGRDRLSDRVERAIRRGLFGGRDVGPSRGIYARLGADQLLVGTRFGSGTWVPDGLPRNVRSEFMVARLRAIRDGTADPIRDWLETHAELLRKVAPGFEASETFDAFVLEPLSLSPDGANFDAWVAADGRVQIG